MKKVKSYSLLLLAVITGLWLEGNRAVDNSELSDNGIHRLSFDYMSETPRTARGTLLPDDYTSELGKRLQECAFTLPGPVSGNTLERTAPVQITRIKDTKGAVIPTAGRFESFLISKYFSQYVLIGNDGSRFEFPADYYIYALRHIII